MNWVSNLGRRFLQAYSEGLAMSCPMSFTPDDMPAAIDLPQDNIRASLRSEFRQTGLGELGSTLRH
ncbi:hypothetical protein Y88_0508 [Novosphingobium nitrogenifigens DSM 19370]|uniref:Uncharacterized protein n=1 Tax=Novosphingobium nitrogenifigens DSM 19370 TaxID=983920 RepID=F1ZAD9_9SPHN|nr:hypothetical protein [Novosphingobium nitrogenifigens]EGD58453.1 hypothetical protein Y88_0508 [Novosphingobium nitrogenifigens DSM 19370]